MADRKISDLTALTTPAAGDYLPIVDISEAAAASKNKRITIEELMRGVPDGTAAAPGIAFETDPNTGIYRPGADQLAVATNGVGRLFVDASGLISAGTSTPADAGITQQGKYVGFATRLATSGQRGYVAQSGDYFLLTANRHPNGTWDDTNRSQAEVGMQCADGGSNIYFKTAAANNTIASERLRITSAGLVGIGTSSPGHKFHVVSADTTTPGFFQHIDGTTTLGNSFSTIHRVASDGNNRYSLSAWQVQNDSGLTQRAFIGSRAVTGAANYNPLMVFGTTTGSGTYDTRMVIDGSGRVGIGITSPGSKFHLYDASNVSMRIEAGAGVPQIELKSSTGSQIISAGGGGTQNLAFTVAGSERFRVDSSGRLLVGTSTNIESQQIQSASTGGNNFGASRFTNGSGGCDIFLTKSRGATVGTHTVVQSGDDLGNLYFRGSDGSSYVSAARISVAVDGAPSANDLPGRLVFSVTADGASSPTERMRISATGRTSCFSSDDAVYSRTAAAAGTSVAVFVGNHTATNTTNGTASSIIWSNGDIVNTNNSYGSISDIKLKENIVDANSQWDDLKALQVRNYNFKEGQTHTQIGLVAQEVELVSPGLVSESPDRDAEGNDLGTVTKSVNYSVLYMKAVKALQEAMERIETLEARLTAAGIA
jgi:hypothetical protein